MRNERAGAMRSLARLLIVPLVLMLYADVPAASLEEGKAELNRLLDRLTTTKALGVLSKLSLKGEVETLLADIGALHNGKGTASLDQLEERYHLMAHKLSLSLQKRDAELARAIADFRDPLWDLLQNPEAYSHLMS